jgi:hypothetical protein
MFAKNWKVFLVVALLLLAAWIAKRNFSPPPSPPAPSAQIPKSGENENATKAGTQGKKGAEASLADVDPTLRLDLLAAARDVKYQGASRNIFEVYTPPPPPAPPRPAAPPVTPPPPAAPKPPDIPLKFYGFAQPSGSNIKQAFLTNGDDILIANEGDVVAKYYKINRIGVSSMELEDIRTKKAELIPLEE